ncbi:50S ribosomal protein L25/general stress protein Ctc [Luteimonas panaciterrae]|uniref:50S ribosomal protein L25/general stress protein Ctc n=1 Tax=Luteimonas panaciterrae TaxID=363885 RepID=UPI001CF9F9D4|nr:50S ribosomal protein L25/general stress protein Ctc [Luteimonas panaciterrae]
MATQHTITAAGRKDEGKGASRRLRRAAQIPAVIYGGHADPQSIQLEHEKTWLASQHEWFYSSILDLEVDGKVQKVLLRDMQRHPFKQLIMHLDFQRVSENEAIRVSVPLHFLNEDKSPAGKSAEVVVTHELNEIEVSCLPKDLPEYIEVDLSDLALGTTVHLSQIKLPKGVEIPELKLGADHDVAVVVARHARVEEEPAAEGEEAANGEKKEEGDK